MLALMGLAYALALPVIGTGSAALELKSATRQLAAGLRKARSTAIARRQSAVLTLDVTGRLFAVSGDPKNYTLPKQVEIALLTARSEQTKASEGSIRFFSDGSSTGGRITLSVGESRQAVDVDWLTGRVSITP